MKFMKTLIKHHNIYHYEPYLPEQNIYHIIVLYNLLRISDNSSCLAVIQIFYILNDFQYISINC
jgi:hypothetical protein